MCYGKLLDLVASEFERALASKARSSIVGKGGEAVDYFKNTQVEPGTLDTFETAEGLVVLGEDTNTCTCAGTGVTCSVELLVVGMMRLSMALTKLGQWRSRKSNQAAALSWPDKAFPLG